MKCSNLIERCAMIQDGESEKLCSTVCFVVFELRKVLSHEMVYYSLLATFPSEFPFFASTKLNHIFYDIVMIRKAERERKRLSCLEIMKMMDRHCNALNPFGMDDVVMTRETNFSEIKLIFAIGMQRGGLACLRNGIEMATMEINGGAKSCQLRVEDENFKRDFSNFC